MAGLRVPLSTLHPRPHGQRRMTRGQDGSLLNTVRHAIWRELRNGLRLRHYHIRQAPAWGTAKSGPADFRSCSPSREEACRKATVRRRVQKDGPGGRKLSCRFRVAVNSAQRSTPPLRSRELLRGVCYCFFFFFFSCSVCRYSSSSLSLAQPWKYRHSISKVRLLGLAPVHRT